jgi:transcriptional regulator with XRE-family HTH domain
VQINNLTTDSAALEEIGRRLAQLRISLNLTQAEVAGNAGIGKRTLERIEAGEPAQTTTLIRVLRALEQMEALNALIPEHQIRPMDMLRHPKGRKRASSRKIPRESNQPWTWGDEE